MASSILISFVPARVRVKATTAKGGGGGGGAKEEKGILDWVLGSLAKEDQFYETDPILNKVEDKGTSSSSSSTRRGGSKNSVALPPKKNGGGGFGGLFAKK